MQTLQTGGVTLHIRDEGPKDGRPLVFSNSLGTDLRVWDALLPHLPEGLRLVRYDKRGHGLSDASPAPYAMETLVADAEAVCDGLGLSGVTFVGLSIGGLIGQGLAAKRPDLLRALVLMDTAAKIGTAEMWDDRIAKITAGGVSALADPILERWFTRDFREAAPEFALWSNMLTRTSVAGYTGCCAAIAGADMTESTRALTLPVLAMAGDQDGSTPPDLVKATAELSNAAFHVIPGAGHLPCIEQPEATAALIAAFLKDTAA
ncbi:3-oxoadipate enol-lactonase [Acidimangrovimonas sediminis]|uniref:3-oxoadipate enol-lactonase n=1 Tax=Acidimangrovimonas sediminis TaxID=2056283 RepID=UPI000C80AE7B|nr:3-oxoadipate enol-lactonase [Acidimangrovimonas sediminis]